MELTSQPNLIVQSSIVASLSLVLFIYLELSWHSKRCKMRILWSRKVGWAIEWWRSYCRIL